MLTVVQSCGDRRKEEARASDRNEIDINRQVHLHPSSESSETTIHISRRTLDILEDSLAVGLVTNDTAKLNR